MATVAMPISMQMREFSRVEGKVQRLSAGLTFSQGMMAFVSGLFSLVHLSGAFKSVVNEQAELIQMLGEQIVLDSDQATFAALAEKIEHVVRTNENVVAMALSLQFRPWEKSLEEMQNQSEHLESIAESFRMACDDESLDILADFARIVDSENSYGSGNLVSTVHA